MNRDDAEEFTQGLGQSLAGNWRMVFWAQRMGVPKALGLTTREWVRERLGGYVDMSIADRQKAVAELDDEGLSAQKTADVLGVHRDTVYEDRKALVGNPASQGETPVGNPTLVFEDEVSKQAIRFGGLTGEVEWYTPREYLDAASEVMGAIDLDPASSDLAQEHVLAGRYFTRREDGLKQNWSGRVFLNPPYKMPDVEQFVQKMISSFEAADIEQGILLTNNAPDTAWYQRAIRACSALCLTRGRISFLKAKDGQVEKREAPIMGQTFFYFGPNVARFCEVFRTRATKNHEPAFAGVVHEGAA